MLKSAIFSFCFFLIFSNSFSQNQALYYFDNGFEEFTKKYPALQVEGEKGEFIEEVVEKFGKEKRKVYRIPESSGLMFDNSKIKNFISGSYGIEMYFRYDDGSMLLYGQLFGDQLASSQGKYVHLVTTRNAKTKLVNVFVNGKLTMNFPDADDNMDIDNKSQVSFFNQEGTKTTSGAVAMIKLYDYFIDENTASNLFDIFQNDNISPNLNPDGVIKNLYFVQSLPILLPESSPELENVFAFLEQNPKVEIELQGHTDNQGDYNLNMKLSKERAEAVKEYLTKKGIKSSRIKTKGFGSLKPIASNAQEETRQKNRRVELQILKK
ncbi:OmpA family protein [Lacihabitans sp. LS3-19]|uniref:OmpA family protein n=1 Tax=Lacihabitans sp. LS3-19 TaxID=2487335 RepID=UPI0020CC575A|nr:OmpA family protein [Lacihabitans sp. LS3-19]MCP9768999.1 OmpA family protein [Lacihabitans sp. LS3-19]